MEALMYDRGGDMFGEYGHWKFKLGSDGRRL